MNLLKNISKNEWIQGLTVATIILIIIFAINFLFFLVKPQKNRKSIKYIYSFSAGFVLITAIIGQFVEAREKLTKFYDNEKNNIIAENMQSLISLSIIICGTLIGATISLLIHQILKKFNKHKKHKEIHNHVHNLDHDYDLITHGHSKIPGIIMLLSHRFPAGLAIGGLVYNTNEIGDNYSMLSLIAFIIHIIPELFIVYFGLLDAGKSKKKVMLYATIANLTIALGIFIGIGFGKISAYSIMFWLQPLIFVTVGTLLVWSVVLELVPEFIHHKENSKIITSMSLIFILGIAFSLFIQFIHSH